MAGRTGAVKPVFQRRNKMKKLMQFAKDESGATAIEYGLIAGGISVAIVTIVFTIGSTLDGMFEAISTELGKAKV